MLEGLGPDIEDFVVPPPVSAGGDFSRTSDHIERVIRSADAWLSLSGLEQGVPHEMRPHSHQAGQGYAAVQKRIYDAAYPGPH